MSDPGFFIRDTFDHPVDIAREFYVELKSIDPNIDNTGVEDVSAQFQRIFDDVSWRRIYIPRGTYKFSEGLVIDRQAEIICDAEAVFDFTDLAVGTALGQQVGLTIGGSVSSTSLTVAAQITVGDYSFTVSDGSSLAAGDYISIRNDTDLIVSLTRTRSFVAKINSVTGNVITLVNAAPITLDANNIVVKKLNMVEKFIFSGGHFIMGGVGSVHTGIYANCLVDSLINGVTIEHAEDTGINLDFFIDSAVQKCAVRYSTSPTPVGNTGYGTLVGSGCMNCYVRECNYQQCRHSTAGGGEICPWYITIERNFSINCGLGTGDVDCHEGCFYWTYDGNTSVQGENGNGGFIIRGSNVKVVNNTVFAAGSAIKVGQFTSGYNVADYPYGGYDISNNSIFDSGTGIEFVVTNTGADGGSLINSVIANNTIQTMDFYGIIVRDATNLTITGNSIGDCEAGIYVFNTNQSAGVPRYLTISSNSINQTRTNTYAIRLVDNVSPTVENSILSIVGNVCKSTGAASGRGIIILGDKYIVNGNFITCTNLALSIVGNDCISSNNQLIQDGTNNTLFFQGNNHVISNNFIKNTNTSAGIPLRGIDNNNTVISGNHISTANSGAAINVVLLSGTGDFAIIRNNLVYAPVSSNRISITFTGSNVQGVSKGSPALNGDNLYVTTA